MKRISTIVAALMITAIGWAQSPEKMSYQAVVRDGSNDLITTQAVGMQISILQGGSEGTPVYVETQTPTTNANGLVNLEIGTGTTSDDFSKIDWANVTYFIKTETDPIGGTSYTITGTTQLLSVPYALYAKTSGSSAGPQGVKGDDGSNGSPGTSGTNGAKGDNGSDGAAGAAGAPGAAGAAGAPGAQGSTGPEGDQGVQGTKGDTGAQGTKGDTGAQGTKGDTGTAGSYGAPGAAGTNGAVGEKGDTGDQGEKGDTGDQGIKGNTGLKGDQGEIGPDGKSAYEVYAANHADPDQNEAEWLKSLEAERQEGPMMYTVNGSDAITTSSTDKVQVAGMMVSPEPGTYIALFNAQVSGASVTTQSFGSNQGVDDLQTLYEELMEDNGNTRSNNVFGNNETLTPGVYNVSGAASTIGTLTIDGGNTVPNPLFIIRATTTFTAGASTRVQLMGNAKSENIFWVAGTSASTAAGAQLKGTILAGGTGAGALSTGADTILEGRMLTKSGAITQGARTKLTAPSGASVANLGSLASFAMWSSAGGVSDVGTSTTIGDVGNISGVLSITGDHTGDVYPKGTKQSDIVTVSPSVYSVYQNGIEVPGSARFFNIISGAVSIQAMITVTTENNPVEIKWNVKSGEAALENRTFTLIRNGY